jgi:NADPH:quinone reductase-like Zn-dependent oxidoreductase
VHRNREVFIMTLLLPVAASITSIIISFSDEKMAKLKDRIPIVHGLNYKTTNIKTEMLRLTGGKGVDFIFNNVGKSSIPDDLDIVRKDGSIALVGFLKRFRADYPLNVLLSLVVKEFSSIKWETADLRRDANNLCRGVLGGSKVDFEASNAFLRREELD